FRVVFVAVAVADLDAAAGDDPRRIAIIRDALGNDVDAAIFDLDAAHGGHGSLIEIIYERVADEDHLLARGHIPDEVLDLRVGDRHGCGERYQRHAGPHAQSAPQEAH